MTLSSRPVVWITGASSGIGWKLAKAFARIDTQVVVTARRRRGLQKIVKEIKGNGGKAIFFVGDVSSKRDVRRISKEIFKRFHKVDVLVNNAGVTYFKSFQETSPKEFNEVLNINLRGTFLCIKAVLDFMIQRRSGHIFNILSTAATTTFTDSVAYSASKAGALALTNVLREEVRKDNIKVTAILPGATETPMWSESARKKYRHRMMQPKDVAEIVVSIYQQPERAMTEQIIVRPILGDLE